MRSGNGRHRRPRQVPALVVTAGVTGSALALPLLAATNASAADTSTWDSVAECESGGTWSANSGSGAYGGLQFTQEQWNNAGGLEFAKRPDLASRSQQIAVGERVLASQGPQAWPLCAASSGLVKDGPAADVDPGALGSPRQVAPSPSRPEAAVPGTGSADPATDFGAPTPAAPAPAAPGPSATAPFTLPIAPLAPNSGLPVMPDPDPATPTPTLPGDPNATAPVTPALPGTPATPGTPSTPATPGAPATPSPSATPSTPAAPAAGTPSATPNAPAADSVTTGGGKHRGPAAVETPAAPDAASEPTYTVKAGDSLAAIADAQGLKGGWNALYEANEQVIGNDADLIKPGQNLDLTKK
ncbi:MULTISPECIES: LysM peptidoglycan-binding domain-containing protein [unclassified Streptomyces]|uniref:LysM peptidoglycan-binding domain-containing protein n=1 Tax=unclassified Streptomyces TaxID=2593676 RepID=UPI002E327D64|nr:MULTISPECIES: transglycosylase family protein [unclassified Streptomyces]WUC66133.1 transglycosylase family protein [Streptomyces sp. NBC_00539]